MRIRQAAMHTLKKSPETSHRYAQLSERNGQIFEESAQCVRDEGRVQWVREPT